VEGLPKVSQICCGAQHTVARVKGSTAFTHDSVYSWGHGGDGQLGLGNYEDQYKPILLEFFKDKQIQRITRIATGARHTLVLTSDNALYAFGANTYGQLGAKDEDDTFSANVPARIRYLPGVENSNVARAEYYGNRPIAMVHANFNSSSIITKSNEVFVWGAVSHTDIGMNFL
jgi:alpha-tubulin suppressor-like RCC1 family protein